MNNELVIKTGDQEFAANYDETEDSVVYIDNEKYHVELLKNYGNGYYSFAVNNKVIQLKMDLDKGGNMAIFSNGFSYELSVKDKTRVILEKFIKESGIMNNSGKGQLKAPMPGMVVKILKQQGDEVKEGEKVIIVEAMKMENALGAPVSGRITNIKAKEGQAVEKDAVLLEVEEV